MSDSVRPHSRQPTRLYCPWDSPGKNTGVGCHFLLQCMKVNSESEVASHVRLFATPWTAAYQPPPSVGFFRQESWSGVPLSSPKQLLEILIESWATFSQERLRSCGMHLQVKMSWKQKAWGYHKSSQGLGHSIGGFDTVTSCVQELEPMYPSRSAMKHDCGCSWSIGSSLADQPSVEFSSAQFSHSVVSHSLCDPMDCSKTGLPVHHQLPEFTQTHVHWVNDTIQPSHPLSSPSPPAFYLSQHHGLFNWVSSSHQVPKVLDFQLQHQSFQWTPRTDLL